MHESARTCVLGRVGEMAWQLVRVQTVTSAARELEEPIRFQIAIT